MTTRHGTGGERRRNRLGGQGGRRGRRRAAAVAGALIACWSASAAAQDCTGNDVRLVRGETDREGSVEMCVGGTWKATCDDDFDDVLGWDDDDAGVVCRQLGYAGGGTATLQSTFGSVDPADYWNRRVECTGTEAALHLCRNELQETQTACHISERAGVRCAENPRVLVSNEHAPQSDLVTLTGRIVAQSFMTGNAAGGYALDAVDVYLTTVASRRASATLRARDSGTIHPGRPIVELAAPGSLAVGWNTFEAPPGVRLEASTTYWVSFNDGIGSGRADVRATRFYGQRGASGWRIGDDGRSRFSDTGQWGTTTTLLVRVRGSSNPATGTVTVTGPPYAERTLTATADPADEDGLPDPVVYAYEWLRVDGDTETPISGATESTYTLRAADVGLKVRALARFRDAGSNPELLESAAYPAQGTVRAADDDPPEVWITETNPAGTEVQIVYREPLDKGSVPPASLFRVTADGARRSVTGVRVFTDDGNLDRVGLTVSPVLTRLQAVTVSYADPNPADDDETGVVQDLVGNDAESFAPREVLQQTDPDVRPPELSRAEAYVRAVRLFYDEDLHEYTVPPADAYTVTVDGTTAAVDGLEVSGTSVRLRLAAPVAAAQTVVLDYAPPATDAVRDLAGNEAAALADVAVENLTGTQEIGNVRLVAGPARGRGPSGDLPAPARGPAGPLRLPAPGAVDHGVRRPLPGTLGDAPAQPSRRWWRARCWASRTGGMWRATAPTPGCASRRSAWTTCAATPATRAVWRSPLNLLKHCWHAGEGLHNCGHDEDVGRALRPTGSRP